MLYVVYEVSQVATSAARRYGHRKRGIAAILKGADTVAAIFSRDLVLEMGG